MPVSPLRTADPPAIGRYLLLGRVADGGMGVVFLGREDGRPDSMVAVKTARQDSHSSEEYAERVRNEARALSALSASVRPGDGLARFVEADSESAQPWIATEYVPGPSLLDLARGHKLPDDGVESLARALAQSIAAVHRGGYAHRDVKPANVVMGPDGARLVDFGLARPAGDPPEEHLMGSPGWSPPEQHDAVDPRPGDVHGWGMSVAYAARGLSPFGDGSAAVLIHRMVNDEPSLVGLNPTVRDLVAAALLPDPAARPRAEDLVSALSPARTLPTYATSASVTDESLADERDLRPGGTQVLGAPTLIDDRTSEHPEKRADDGRPGGMRRVLVTTAAALLATGVAVVVAQGDPAPSASATASVPSARPTPTAPTPSASTTTHPRPVVATRTPTHGGTAHPGRAKGKKSKGHGRKH